MWSMISKMNFRWWSVRPHNSFGLCVSPTVPERVVSFLDLVWFSVHCHSVVCFQCSPRVQRWWSLSVCRDISRFSLNRADDGNPTMFGQRLFQKCCCLFTFRFVNLSHFREQRLLPDHTSKDSATSGALFIFYYIISLYIISVTCCQFISLIITYFTRYLYALHNIFSLFCLCPKCSEMCSWHEIQMRFFFI